LRVECMMPASARDYISHTPTRSQPQPTTSVSHMVEDVYKQLRAEIESQQQVPLKDDKESLKRRAEIEVEVERQLQHMLFFRTHVFSNMPDYLRTVLMLARKKLDSSGLGEYIKLSFPINGDAETDLGYEIPLRSEKSEKVELYQALLSAKLPSKPSRHFLIVCKADSANATINVDVDVFDNLGRKIRILPSEFKQVDAFSEFKDGEFLLTIQCLVGPAIELCLKNLMD